MSTIGLPARYPYTKGTHVYPGDLSTISPYLVPGTLIRITLNIILRWNQSPGASHCVSPVDLL